MLFSHLHWPSTTSSKVAVVGIACGVVGYYLAKRAEINSYTHVQSTTNNHATKSTLFYQQSIYIVSRNPKYVCSLLISFGISHLIWNNYLKHLQSLMDPHLVKLTKQIVDQQVQLPLMRKIGVDININVSNIIASYIAYFPAISATLYTIYANYFIITPKEAKLLLKYGNNYKFYCGKVPRFLHLFKALKLIKNVVRASVQTVMISFLCLMYYTGISEPAFKLIDSIFSTIIKRSDLPFQKVKANLHNLKLSIKWKWYNAFDMMNLDIGDDVPNFNVYLSNGLLNNNNNYNNNKEKIGQLLSLNSIIDKNKISILNFGSCT